jgi:predicted nucleotidyltransferase
MRVNFRSIEKEAIGVVMTYLRKAVEKSDAEVIFAAVFGSYITGFFETSSDIDLLVVCEGNEDNKIIRRDMKRLGKRIGREIHLNYYTIDDFERRLKYHDYKMGSILQDSMILVDHENYAKRLNELVRGGGRIDDASIMFNETMGVKSIYRAIKCLRNFKRYYTLSSNNLRARTKSRYFQILTIRNAHVALGYLLASQEMKQTNRVTTLKGLLSQGRPLLRTLISIDKRIKKMEDVDMKDTEEYLRKVVSEFEKAEVTLDYTNY